MIWLGGDGLEEGGRIIRHKQTECSESWKQFTAGCQIDVLEETA